ncbi:hypothetical protein GCM10018787_28270 [Streptomyces thermodiastaticus]|nr:hypothetical protein GCM10018787_28270 [Streptomyces thermodiastaticus]
MNPAAAPDPRAACRPGRGPSPDAPGPFPGSVPFRRRTGARNVVHRAAHFSGTPQEFTGWLSNTLSGDGHSPDVFLSRPPRPRDRPQAVSHGSTRPLPERRQRARPLHKRLAGSDSVFAILRRNGRIAQV